MKRILLIALAVGVLIVIGPVATASADTPGCVTKREFRSVHRGATKLRVRRVFDTAGRQSSWFNIGGDVYETREYKTCGSRYGLVSIDYVNRRLNSKFAFWG